MKTAKTLIKIIEDAYQLLNREVMDKVFIEINNQLIQKNQKYQIVIGGGAPLIYHDLIQRDGTEDIDSVSANQIMYMKSIIYDSRINLI